MLAEGLCLHFEELSPKARDRISRALLLGKAMGYKTIVSLAAAWKAHIEFQSGDFDAMVLSIQDSIANCTSNDLDAITRRSIVVCNCLMICGQRQAAMRWFDTARRAAVENGDQASIEALIYNKAAFLTTWLRAENCLSPVDQSSVLSVRSEIASARNFQNLIGIAALTVHIHLWDARQYLLSKEYAAAAEKLTALRSELPENDESFGRSYIDLEISFCLALQERRDEAFRLYESLPVIDLERLDVDEQLVATWMRLEMSRRDGRFGVVDDLASAFDRLSSEYTAYKEGLLQRLSDLGVTENRE